MKKEQANVIWLTGISGSGKTTLGLRLKEELKKKHGRVEFIDGDLVREFFDYLPERKGFCQSVSLLRPAGWFKAHWLKHLKVNGLSTLVLVTRLL